MAIPELLHQRLLSQQIASTTFKKPEEIVSWMGAMQAQEYAMAKWAIGLRLKTVRDNDIESAFNEGKILRTHILRPTWHFVTPGDIRWMITLTAPRIHAINAYTYRECGYDNKFFNRCNRIISKSLQGNDSLTREELRLVLEKSKIYSDGIALSAIMMHAELDSIICSGPRKGNQFTYSLLDKKVPEVNTLSKEESLAELAKRFFNSRSPATIQDLAYWASLSQKEARQGYELVKEHFEKKSIADKEYIFSPNNGPASKNFEPGFLMPDYDEYGMSYKDRSILSNPAFKGRIEYNRMVVLDGRICGTWHRTIKNDTLLLKIVPNIKFNKMQQQKIITLTKNFGKFLGKRVELAGVY